MERRAYLGAAGIIAAALAASACGSSDDKMNTKLLYSKLLPISNFEKGLALDEPFEGTWAGSADDSGGPADQNQTVAIIDVDSPRDDGVVSKRALRVAAGEKYAKWGTALFAELKTKEGYDLSDYNGISLWIRSDGPIIPIKVSLPDYYTMDTVGLCDPNDTKVGGRGCYDDYSIRVYPNNTWTRYDITLRNLTTGNWGYPHDFDIKHVLRIKLSMLPQLPYDISIDDLTFYKR